MTSFMTTTKPLNHETSAGKGNCNCSFNLNKVLGTGNDGVQQRMETAVLYSRGLTLNPKPSKPDCTGASGGCQS